MDKTIPSGYFFKWAISGLFFLYFRLFNTQLTVNKYSIFIILIFADDWIRSAGLWYRKRPLYQLSHTVTSKLKSLDFKYRYGRYKYFFAVFRRSFSRPLFRLFSEKPLEVVNVQRYRNWMGRI